VSPKSSAILRCRTAESGTAAIHCHDCASEDSFPLSCGHRACPQCQNEAVEQWLERQRAKLLPVDYYLLTFTLPAQLRPLVYSHQRTAYDLLMEPGTQYLFHHRNTASIGIMSPSFPINSREVVVRIISWPNSVGTILHSHEHVMLATLSQLHRLK
jgi:hypothetical protein